MSARKRMVNIKKCIADNIMSHNEKVDKLCNHSVRSGSQPVNHYRGVSNFYLL